MLLVSTNVSTILLLKLMATRASGSLKTEPCNQLKQIFLPDINLQDATGTVVRMAVLRDHVSSRTSTVIEL
jgi:hypothetical protein